MANTNKATHIGECQCCGSRQKLPNGKLSKHGYTVKWGFFSGVCMGAGYLPLEVSCDQLKVYVQWAEDKRAALQDGHDQIGRLADAVTTEEGEAEAYCRVYVSSKLGRGHYEWQTLKVRATFVPGQYAYTRLEISKDGGQTWTRDPYYGNVMSNLQEYVRFLNAKRQAELVNEMAQLTDYITWQTERIAKWVARPLTELK